MSEPKKRNSKSRKNKRRVNHSAVATQVKKCSRCGKPVKPHTTCTGCGTYNK